ncbi:MAG: hypothetical protein HYR85_11935 [Planctomycetes bacterium]|nr:hypothetical protein [Planctomycetota bacterium]MBI3843933.1 hypothetical protein [Planctomycetota bacterium]
MRGSLAALAAVGFALAQGKTETKESVVSQDFSKSDLGADWKTSGAAWKVEGGELRGVGAGSLQYVPPLMGDFALTFKASADSKANVEVKLVDPKDGHVRFTFAFIGRFHPVLDGVKSAILKNDAFVKVEPKMWIWPGKTFDFEVRCAKNQYQMFLDDELGPVFVDPDPPAEPQALRVQIEITPEGAKDSVKLDDVTIRLRR